jgi:hypothetical protein
VSWKRNWGRPEWYTQAILAKEKALRRDEFALIQDRLRQRKKRVL